MRESLTQRLAPVIASAQATPEAVAALKLCLLDFLSCAFEAHTLPWSRQAAEVAARSHGPASIVGGPHNVAVQAAAFANAVAGHGLVREDMHAGAVSHLGVVVLPAMLALSQQQRVSGREFAAACIVGYEVGARIGRALVTPAFMRQWRPTGFTGPLAAAAAGARLLQLSPPAVASALALAANTVGGLNEWPRDGGEEMFFHPGFATRNALMAVELAALGAYGSSGALDGAAGLFAAAGMVPAPDVRLFEGAAEIESVFRKALPVCNFAQTPCQAALQIVQAHALPATDIARVTIRASAAAVEYPGCNGRGPFERVLQAKMSIPFCVASALLDAAVTEACFADLKRAPLLRLIALTTLEQDPVFSQAFPARQGAEVVVELRDGVRHRARMDDLQAATAAMVAARFARAAHAVIGATRSEELSAAVSALEKVDDIGALMRLSAQT
ncbi:MAG TPA: MmgE/PrpD family protein [Steroidobacteraceae bacterium]